MVFIHPQPVPLAPPALVQVQAPGVAPNAGAAGTSGAAATAAPRSGRTGVRSDNGGQLAGSAVPGGVNHAPATGGKPSSFSGPVKRD